MAKTPKTPLKETVPPDGGLRAGEVVPIEGDPREYPYFGAAVEQLPVQNCSTCAGWKPLGNDPVLGQCVPSRRAMPAPLVTTDLTTCSRWTPRAE